MEKVIKKQNKKERVVGGLTVVLLEGDLPDELDECLTEALEYIEELTTPRWYTPEQWEQRTGKPYPDEAPVWVVSKYAILEKPTKYNKLRWQLVVYKEAKDNMVVGIIFCAYNHLGPPPGDWRPEVKE
jgi:hypothetical protein